MLLHSGILFLIISSAQGPVLASTPTIATSGTQSHSHAAFVRPKTVHNPRVEQFSRMFKRIAGREDSFTARWKGTLRLLCEAFDSRENRALIPHLRAVLRYLEEAELNIRQKPARTLKESTEVLIPLMRGELNGFPFAQRLEQMSDRHWAQLRTTDVMESGPNLEKKISISAIAHPDGDGRNVLGQNIRVVYHQAPNLLRLGGEIEVPSVIEVAGQNLPNTNADAL